MGKKFSQIFYSFMSFCRILCIYVMQSRRFLQPPAFLSHFSRIFDPLKMSLEMAHKVIVPEKKITSRSFLNSGTLIVI